MQGLASDKGLLVPETIPTFPAGAPEIWRGLSFEDLAFEIMSLYIPREEVEEDALRDIIKRSYSTFRDSDVTPVKSITDDMHVMELFHGPTFAFKDVALQFLGNLFEHLLKQRPGQTITVVGATSGDTGSSAIHGLRGKKGVDCFILYPDGRTSRRQELQMISILDENIHSVALGGTFDDCQAIVKACFNDHPFRDAHSLAAVNSINWARILAQQVYYVHSYLKVTQAPAPGAPAPKVSFSVPTGNFGDILAGYYAKAMGLPIDQLIVATNSNDILHRFFSDADYSVNSGGVAATISPSMDIQVSSNFERFLCHMTGDDTAEMHKLMSGFEETTKLQPSEALVAACRKEMVSARVTDEEILETIRDVHARTSDSYTLDPHSAIGVAAARKIGKTAGVPMVCLACAHWAKFPDANQAALGEQTSSALVVPEPLASLHTLPTRVKNLPNSVDEIQSFIKKTLAARNA
uniref:Threonine synthase N-terminal domain-containing protein n=1 Tax=Haptolina ericina TaxID=156174 RepID=A0A7S3AUL0_9EUKA